eukprot:TRINITY_DN84401_c0_g1_i1.p1 TRINITY_DN84401_c0_g1~~TRINITY_DN84401_c0_g1_i1.p1  ORF type:complete len:310 (-),score=85.78 TRINITY_DN84401_c0_g1_i1:272-1201(-)
MATLWESLGFCTSGGCCRGESDAAATTIVAVGPSKDLMQETREKKQLPSAASQQLEAQEAASRVHEAKRWKPESIDDAFLEAPDNAEPLDPPSPIDTPQAEKAVEESETAAANTAGAPTAKAGSRFRPTPADKDLSTMFPARISKERGVTWGIEVTSIEGSVIITGISPGPLADWNVERAQLGQPKIREGDRFVEVNGLRGEGTRMMEMLNLKDTLEAVVMMRDEYLVSVYKGKASLGVNISIKKGREGLVVSKVDDGPIMTWNQTNPALPVKDKDRIVEVNGFRGEPRPMLERLKAADTLDLLVVPFS